MEMMLTIVPGSLRRPQVDRHVLIEKLDRGVQQRAASSETG
jgi:hypothetical protein